MGTEYEKKNTYILMNDSHREMFIVSLMVDGTYGDDNLRGFCRILAKSKKRNTLDVDISRYFAIRKFIIGAFTTNLDI